MSSMNLRPSVPDEPETNLRNPRVVDNGRAEFFARQISCQLNCGNWHAAHSLVDEYRLEVTQTHRTRKNQLQWLEEPLSTVPGIPLKVLNQIERFFEILFVGQFLRVVPDVDTLLQAPHLAETAALKIGLALRDIGIKWPVYTKALPSENQSPPTPHRMEDALPKSSTNNTTVLATPKLLKVSRRPKARCRYCGRYSNDLQAAIATNFPCACGYDDGWLSKFPRTQSQQ